MFFFSSVPFVHFVRTFVVAVSVACRRIIRRVQAIVRGLPVGTSRLHSGSSSTSTRGGVSLAAAFGRYGFPSFFGALFGGSPF